MLKTILGFTTMVLLRPLFTNFRTIGETFYLDCLFLLHCTLNKSLTVFYLRKYGIFGVVLYYMFFYSNVKKITKRLSWSFHKVDLMVTLKQKAGLFQIGLNWYPNAPLFCVKNEEGQRVRASFYMHNKLVHGMMKKTETYFSKESIYHHKVRSDGKDWGQRA